MKLTVASFLIMFTLVDRIMGVITVKNPEGKTLRSDYMQQVLAETEYYRNNNNPLGLNQQLDLNAIFAQQTTQKCSSDKDCLNGGICNQSACYCKNLFVGDLCQYQLNQPIEVTTAMFVIICIAAVVAGILLMIFINYIMKLRQENKLKREGEYNNNKYEIWQQKLDDNR